MNQITVNETHPLYGLLSYEQGKDEQLEAALDQIETVKQEAINTANDYEKKISELTLSERDIKINNLFIIGMSWGTVLNIPYKINADYVTDHSMDCSLFTKKDFATQGVTLPRNSRQQSLVGSEVKYEDIQRGDLVFFDTNQDGIINHVGIADGNGNMLHTNRAGLPIRLQSIAEYIKTSKFMTARRVI